MLTAAICSSNLHRRQVGMSFRGRRIPAARNMPSPSQKIATVLNLNVGGQIYTTTLSTLTRFPGSKLAEMFRGHTRLPVDSKGRHFIDRKGTYFKYILEFLRTQEPPSQFVEEVYQEALFYGIEPLVKHLEDLPEIYGELVGRQNFLAQVANYRENIEVIIQLARADTVAARQSIVMVCVVKSREDNAEYLQTISRLGSSKDLIVKFGPWDPSPTVSDMLHCIKMDIEKRGYKVSYQPYGMVKRPLSKPCKFFYELIFTWW
ncbi:BTB/POZ domain-containing protein KCTD14-like [Pristis pectinata]|uniref:BTB/POZ domain-containing protein KCTD14-like n=1 Tax=Pristis pectinata TaxID=685728 RepID=UPI00223E3B0E|nr:BTB/POZ domain-containing protein KCTD14-like [Pristis pectinata]